MSTIENFDASVTKLELERASLFSADNDLYTRMREVDRRGDEYATLRAQIDKNWEQEQALAIKIQQMRLEHRVESRRFRRPTGPIGSFFSKWLGPLPKYDWRIDPTAKVFAKAKSYRLLAFVLAILAIAALITLIITVPWMGISPASLIFLLTNAVFGETWGGLIGLILIVWLGLFCSKRVRDQNSYEGKLLDKAAMLEEQWFRMGAENWSIGQRVRSCIAFSGVHILNIFYPLASLVVVGLMGAMFLMVYLRVFKQTGSTKHATIASAKLHATYNRFAFGYLIVALGISLVAQVYPMFV